MGPGRNWWIGELLEPISGHPEEKWCMHITTPYKTVVFGMNLADFLVYATFAEIVHGPQLIRIGLRLWLTCTKKRQCRSPN